MTKNKLLKILADNQSLIEDEEWDIIYSKLTKVTRHEFSKFLIENEVDVEKILHKNIPERAFYACDELTIFIMEDSIKRIENSAFMNCSNLKKIHISATLNGGGFHAFEGCTSLVDVDIPDTIKDFNCGHAFAGCTSLVSIKIPDNNHSDLFYTFAGCTSLKQVYLGKHTKYIDTYAFANCISLEEITLPKSIESISFDAFSGCTSLKIIYYEGSAKQWKKIRGSEDFPQTYLLKFLK